MKPLTPAFMKHIGDYMLVETPLARADVCLIFGSKRGDALAQHAAALYHQGYFEKIISSGGKRMPNGEIEAHRMREVLVQHGVPEKAIFVEDRSQNTGENVTFSRYRMQRVWDMGDARSVIGIGQMHAARRFLMTLEAHWPQAVKMFTAPNPYDTPREDWHTHPKMKAEVMREYSKILPYKKLGHFREIDLRKIEAEIARLATAQAVCKGGSCPTEGTAPAPPSSQTQRQGMPGRVAG